LMFCLYLCMYVCMYVCMHIYTYIYIYIYYMYDMYVHVRVCMCKCMSVPYERMVSVASRGLRRPHKCQKRPTIGTKETYYMGLFKN